MVSEAKKTSTEMLWSVVNDCMQIMGGIGYTNVYPVERFLRDARLQMIWTGTNEVMNLLIQHEYYKELLARRKTRATSSWMPPTRRVKKRRFMSKLLLLAKRERGKIFLRMQKVASSWGNE